MRREPAEQDRLDQSLVRDDAAQFSSHVETAQFFQCYGQSVPPPARQFYGSFYTAADGHPHFRAPNGADYDLTSGGGGGIPVGGSLPGPGGGFGPGSLFILIPPAGQPVLYQNIGTDAAPVWVAGSFVVGNPADWATPPGVPTNAADAIDRIARLLVLHLGTPIP